jgi:amidophosphoribosyltransferase
MELVAHERDASAIAKYIGADHVIFQTLPDLIAACAQLSPRNPKTQTFEVGVFCGKYVTPVQDDYFERLERLRGANMKMKERQQARAAVANGTADEAELRAATEAMDISLHNLADYQN